MNSKWLKAFDTLADCLHFGQAAERLCMTQPALTKHVQQMEDWLGGTLFERDRRGTRLTALGRSLHGEAKALQRHTEGFWQHARRAAQGNVGRLDIGFGLSSIDIAPQWVARFRLHYPEVDIQLDDMSSAEQTARLLSGDIQLGFTRLPAPAPLRSIVLHTDQLALASPQADRGGSRFADFADTALIALRPQRGPGLTQHILQLYQRHGRTPAISQYTSDIQTVLALVAAGAGSAIVPMSAQAIAPRHIQLRPVNDNPELTRWQIGLVWNPALDNAVRDRFVEHVARDTDKAS